jgi:hypothetical protein
LFSQYSLHKNEDGVFSMKHAFLGLSGSVFASLIMGLVSNSAIAASCAGVVAWGNSATYVLGNKVVQGGALYEAKWSTLNENPSQSGEWGAWKNLGVCSSEMPPPMGVDLIMRHAERTLTLAPGEEGFVASACLAGEAAVSGGPSSIPAAPPVILYSTITFDGNRSGWIVEYKNTGATPVTVTPRTSVTCAKGRISLAN